MDMTADTGGFAATLGEWAMGNSDWTCRDDGSKSDCDFDAFATVQRHNLI